MTGFALKLIALVAMLLDHIGALGIPYLLPGFGLPGYLILRSIGRIALPLYLFLVAEGCRHTRSPARYLGRLGGFALLSEPPFDLFCSCADGPPEPGALPVLWNPGYQNIFWGLFLGALLVQCVRYLWAGRCRPLAVLPVLLLPACANILKVDYGYVVPICILLLYLAKDRKTQVAAMLVYPVLHYGLDLLRHFHRFNLLYFLCCCLAAVLVLLYNGKRGHYLSKWFFYWFYPVHLTVLSIFQLLVVFPIFYNT